MTLLDYSSPYYYCISEAYIKSMLSKYEGGAELFSSLSLENKVCCVKAKQKLEDFLLSKGLLCRSWWSAVESFTGTNPFFYISVKLSDVKYYFDRYTGWPSVFVSTHKHGFKRIDIIFYLILLMHDGRKKRKGTNYKGTAIENTGATKFDMLAKMLWDKENSRIILTPIIISEIR